MPVPLDRIDLAPGVVAAFTGRHPRGEVALVGAEVHGDDDPSGLRDPANLAHHRPHVPSLLAVARRSVADQLGIAVTDLHLMRQVHGADVATIGPDAPRGLEVRDVDAMVTEQPGRALVVQAADCVPVLAAHDAGPVGVAHAGRAGVQRGVVLELLEALARFGGVGELHVAIGPSIGGCCYEVPDAMAEEVRASLGGLLGDLADQALERASTTTTWGTTSLDLPGIVAATARARGVADVRESPGCTRCGGGVPDQQGRWFSHRRDPASGRHWGVVLRPAVTAGEVAA